MSAARSPRISDLIPVRFSSIVVSGSLAGAAWICPATDLDSDVLVSHSDLVLAVCLARIRRAAEEERGQRDSRRDLGRVGGKPEPVGSPAAELPEHRAERLTGFGQLITPGAPFPDLSHDALLLEGPQPRREDVGWDAAEAFEQLGVAARPEEQVADDQERPALADDVERRPHGTEGLVADRRSHALSIPDLTWIVQACYYFDLPS